MTDIITQRPVRTRPDALAGYDWREAFAYGGDTENDAEFPRSSVSGHGNPMRVEGATCSTDAVLRRDVAEVRHISEGENDGPDWIVCGRLHDGRWFFLTAGCDYTGWDCQAGGQCWVADSYDAIAQFGFTSDARSRWGL